MGFNNYGRFPEYVPVAERKEKIAKSVASFKKKNKKTDLQPIVVVGKLVAKKPWGKAWFNTLASYADYAYRLERGRAYVRYGAVIDLQIRAGEINALVSGTRMYTVRIAIVPAKQELWRNLVNQCSGKINSLVELLQGTFSNEIMQTIIHPEYGLFPKSSEMKFDCSCPDYASMCKHVSAALYGVGIRFDTSPEQLFLLRNVNQADLLASAVQNISHVIDNAAGKNEIEGDLSQLFGVDIADAVPKTTKRVKKSKVQTKMKKKNT